MNNNYRLLNLVYFDFSTKYPKLIVDQHDFNIERRTKRRTSWACALYYQTKCKIYFDVGQKNPKIVIEGHDFLVRKKETKSTYWICSQYYHPKGERCKAQVVTTGRNAYIQGQHNHTPRVKPEKISSMFSQNFNLIYSK
ncbi:hypothetical protein GWI33_002743 [Rhynchophorus ferrugineus]|uniref:FLYWCH-type domain-containing protein n=1 Tax=Rhynchophorus ferrugineus TaxID=354439 RepID=A0A834IK63_RHYFE|nr:hypothetical protein GWI33_002743 [Rhynchophorus ferrugineus]